MVMRETLGSSVGATLSVSILNPRPLNMPAMRVSTPNLFSTRTEMVWRMIFGRKGGERGEDDWGRQTETPVHDPPILLGECPPFAAAMSLQVQQVLPR